MNLDGAFARMNMANSMTEFARDIAKQQDAALMRQLNWLVSRGILVMHTKPGKILMQNGSNELIYSQQIELVVKDKEYIENLEAQIKQLREPTTDAILNILDTHGRMLDLSAIITAAVDLLKDVRR